MSTFWAKRRAAVAAEAEAEAQAALAAERAVTEAELAERDDAEILAELDLPDPDTLGPGDDFKAFLTEAVPARLKARALRRLWMSNPVLANVDGLVDYGGDFTDAALAVENIQTAYQVGKGMTAHVEELARQAEEAEQKSRGTEVPEASGEDADDTPATEPDLSPQNDPEAEVPSLPDADPAAPVPMAAIEQSPEEDCAPIVSRRMRFSFPGTEQTT